MAAEALAIASDPQRSMEAAQKLLEGMRAARTVRSESTKVALVADLVHASGAGELLPLRPEALEAPFGAMKAAGY